MPWQRSFQLKDFNDFWRISPVQFYNGCGALELQKSLLDKGKKKKWPEWEKYTETAVGKDEFYVGSSPMHYALTDLLYENKDHPRYRREIEEIRAFLEQELQRPLVTLSKTLHVPLPFPDSVIHTQGVKSYNQLEHLFGSNGYLNQLWDADRICAALFGEEDWGRVNRVNHWLSNKDTSIARNNTKPQKVKDRCVCFGIGKDFTVCIDASTKYHDFPAFGMRIRGIREMDY